MHNLIQFILLSILLTACGPAPAATRAPAADTIPPTRLITSTPEDMPTILPTQITTQITKLFEWSLPSPRKKDIAWSIEGEPFVVVPAGSSSGKPSGGAVMYDANSLNEVWRIEPLGVTLYLSSAAFSPSGEIVAFYADGIHVHDATSVPMITVPQINNPGRCLISKHFAKNIVWLHDGKTIVVGVNDERQKSSTTVEVQLWDTSSSSPKCAEVFAKVEGTFRSLDLNAKGDYLALSTRQSLISDVVTGIREVGQTQVWNIATKQQTCQIDGALVAKFNPTNDLLLVSDFEKGNLAYWDVEKCELIQPLVNSSHPYDFAFSADGQFLVVNEGNILIIDPISGKTLSKIDSPLTPDEPTWYLDATLSISPNGNYLVYSVPNAPRGSKLFLWKINK